MTEYFTLPEEFRGQDFENIKTQAASCQRCELCQTRNHVVFGQGPVPCDIMLIGEAPGADEDEQGIPFVGRAGQLLTKILESVDIKRPSDIYIANTIKCRRSA
jgi:DNA polymerase